MAKELSQRASAVQASATMAIDAIFKEMKARGEDVVGFGTGEPDFDTPDNIKAAAIKAMKEGKTKYTAASGIIELRKAICHKLKEENGLSYEPENIVVSNGGKHSVYNVFTAILNPGDEVILPAPYWVSYYEIIMMAGGIPHIVNTTEETRFKITPKQLKAAINERTKAFLLNTPSNPSGTVYNKEELQALADVCVENDIYVMSDEMYEKLIYDGYQHISIASLGDKIKDLTITVGGVSKSYAMTGWRIGYTASNRHIATIMGNYQSHSTSSPNSIAQYAALEALLGPQDKIEEMRNAFCERRDYMVNRINSMPNISCLKPEGAFYVMMSVEKLIGTKMYDTVINDSADFCKVMLEKVGVAAVPLTSFGCPNHIRWSYATSMKNIEKGLDRLEKLLTGQC
jgi:aspartate aminotransferase